MKKSLVKLAALSSAAFVLAGTVAPVVLAEEPAQGVEETEKAPEKGDNEVGFDSKEAAEAAAKGEIGKDKPNKSFTVSQGLNGKWFYVLSTEETTKDETPTPETPAPEDEKKPRVTIDEYKKIKAPEEAEKLTSKKFETKKEAEDALKAYLDEYKGIIHNSGKVVEEFGGWYVKLSPEVVEETTTPETTEENKVEGFDTKEAAEAAAKKALETDKVNKSFTVSQGANGKWFYVLSPVEAEKPADPKPETPKPETPEKDLDTVKKEALARLDLLKALTKAEVEHFTKAILNAESANEVAAIIKEAEDVNFSVNLEAETPAKEVKPEESKEGSKKEEKKEDKKEKLPETGEVSSFAIFGGAALSVLAGLGLVASKKEEK